VGIMISRRVLNVGGGSRSTRIPSHYNGWTHDLLDVDPTRKPDILLDARDLASLAPESWDAVYCSHCLEHFHAHEVPRVLNGFRHVLKKDGFA
jgi:predicted SAM-dependent methyltransferase